ncbi:MAG: ferrous iron transport protein A [Christensenellaceae bacterium]|jgi:ferrous iron transport protein A|nr:ferrous iron transport protein A [Christensenellaceae bacterium]
MPLTLARPGEDASIKKVGGSPETRQFLEKLGFVPGTKLTVVGTISGDMIVGVKESRVAISREMAAKIWI